MSFTKHIMLASLLTLICSCELNNSIESIADSKDRNKLFLELKADGSGAAIDGVYEAYIGETIHVFAIERSTTGDFLKNTDVNWTLTGQNGSLDISPGKKDAVFTATSAGLGDIKVDIGLAITSVTFNVAASGSTWTFTDPLKYIFDMEFIDISGDLASLKKVDQTHTAEDFNLGTHNGTYLDANDNLTLKTKLHSSLDITNVFPTQLANLIGYWRMNGDWNDTSGLLNHGTANGGVDFSSDTTLGASSGIFDGTDDYVALSTVAGLPIHSTGDYTIMFWVKGAAQVGKKIYSEGNSVGGPSSIIIATDNSSGNKLRLFMRSDTGSTTSLVSNEIVFDSTWHHIAVVSQANLISLTVDGFKQSGSLALAAGGFTLDRSTIGAEGAAIVNGFFAGNINELNIWSIPFSDADIKKLFKIQLQASSSLSLSWFPRFSNIIAYWKLDGNWLDSSGNGHDLITNVGALSFNADAKVGSQSGVFGGLSTISSVTTPDISNQSFSIVAWAKRSGIGTYDIIFGQGNTVAGTGLHFGFRNTNSFILAFWGDDLNTANAYTETDVWHHWAGTYNSGTRARKIYRDGILVASDIAAANYQGTGTMCVGGSTSTCGNQYGGNIDELSFWNIDLSADEIEMIYNRQKQKKIGHYDSPIINFGTTGNWDSIGFITSLPFLKELALTPESTADYSLLYTGNTLTTGLVGYWPLNGNGNDLSGNALHTTVASTDGFLTNARFGQSLSFDGNDSALVTDQAILNITSTISLSAWVYSEKFDLGSWQGIVGKNFGAPFSDRQYSLRPGLSDRSAQFCIWSGSAEYCVVSGTGILTNGNWHFLVGTYDGTDLKIYVNGTEVGTDPIGSRVINSTTGSFGIGGATANYPFTGQIDEVALWSRSLASVEIEQLYRRGANRLKYQVKSCVDAACLCESYNTSPLGNANDCDGDGTLNAVDTADIYFSNWLGKDATSSTVFSEAQNCTTLDGSGNCVDTVASASPNFIFSDYPMGGKPISNQYFQYRVIMEADMNLLCNAGTEICLPELTSVDIGPKDRYFGNSPSLSPTTSFSYTNIFNIAFTELGSCTLTYQLTPDGTNYYFYNGSSWAAATNLAESSSAANISSNITSFTQTAGSGNLSWRAFLTSDTAQSCQIDEISVAVESAP